MDPITASQALHIIAQKIDLSSSPSISEVTSELEQVLRYIESDDVRTAGPIDWMKKMKRKVLDKKGAKKIVEKLDKLKSLMKWSVKVGKKVRNGDDMTDIVSDDDFKKVLIGAAEYMKGGSDSLELLWTDADSFDFKELDEYWSDNEDDEESDREIIVNAIFEFHEACKSRIKKNEKMLDRQREREKEKGLSSPKSKRRKPEEDEPEEDEPEEDEPEVEPEEVEPEEVEPEEDEPEEDEPEEEPKPKAKSKAKPKAKSKDKADNYDKAKPKAKKPEPRAKPKP